MTTVTPGQFLGLAGRGLDDADWAANDAVRLKGQQAEMRTGAVLYELTKRGPTVINDLRIPIPGFTANIDHVVLYGNKVLILDTKTWGAGFYWTLNSQTRRGFEKFPYADKQTLPMAVKSVQSFLHRKGIDAKFPNPAIVVWPTGPAQFWAYSPAGGARTVQGARLAGWLNRNVPSKNANPNIMVALAELAH